VTPIGDKPVFDDQRTSPVAASKALTLPSDRSVSKTVPP